MTRIAALFLLAPLLAVGCVSQRGHIQPITIDELRDYREARLEERLRSRLVVTMQRPPLTKDSTDDGAIMQQKLLENGQRMGALVGLQLVDHYPIDALGVHVYVYEAETGPVPERALKRLEREPDVKSVQRLNLFRTQAAPGSVDASRPEVELDPLAPLQAIPVEQLAQLHALATGAGVTIAVVDTGIDIDHEDFAGARLQARDLVNDASTVPAETHATAVTGVMLAQPFNDMGIHGIAPDARVIVLRACWQEYVDAAAYCNTFTLAKALAAALDANVDIVNLSLTGPMDPLLVGLVERLQANNVIVVAAHQDEPGQGPFPATLPGVIAATSRPVYARDPGPVFAPGNDIITLLPDDRYGLRDGSSISAAQVSAVVSLFRERDDTITAEVLEALLHGRGVEEEGLAGLIEALRATGR